MIKLRRAQRKNILSFIEMEQAVDTKDYIIPFTAQRHQEEMNKDNVIYLAIFHDELLSGFIILASNDGFINTEFKRIVIASKGQGLGQLSISEMEAYCLNHFNCQRIWLDVFSSNKRGQHIYRKLGYQEFKTEPYGDTHLVYMDKQIN